MIKRLLAFVALVVLSGVAASADFSVIRTYTHPLILSDGKDPKTAEVVGNGSGVMIKPKFMLTAAHNINIKPGRTLWILYDGEALPITVVKKDNDLDLALITSPNIKCPCATLATTAQVDEPVWSVGFPMFTLYSTQFVTTGLLQGVIEGRLVSSATAAPGSSGGGLFVKRDTQFALAGIVVAISATPLGDPKLKLDKETTWITFSVSARLIKDFLKGTPVEIK